MTVETRLTPDWDPMDPTVTADPLAAHAELRECCPVAYSDRWDGFWGLFRYDDVVAAALDTETFTSAEKTTIPDSTGPGRPPRPPLECDRPQHTGYRRLLAPYFSRERIRQWEPRIREIATELVDSATREVEADLVSTVALPMPALVLCAMLGLPADDWLELKSWSTEVIEAARSGDGDLRARANDALYGYVREVVANRRARPRDPASDLVTGLLELQIDGQPLSDDGITGVIRLLLQAGHNTTTNGIASAFHHLATHSNAQSLLRAEPDRISLAVDEILRAYPPAQLMGRTVKREIEIGGHTLKPGTKVALFWSSANHDPRMFPNPDEVNLDRAPNPHVAFGYGIHRCLGAELARAELRIAVEQLLARTTGFTLTKPGMEIGWPNIGPAAVAVRFEPAP